MNALNIALLHDEGRRARVVENPHIRQPQNLPAQRPLEQRPAQQQPFEPTGESRLVVAVLKPAEVADDVARHGAGLEQISVDRRKERLQALNPLASSP